MAGFGGADKFGERGARSPGSPGENIWRENGSRRDGLKRGSGFALWRGWEFGAMRGATGWTGAANQGCGSNLGKSGDLGGRRILISGEHNSQLQSPHPPVWRLL